MSGNSSRTQTAILVAVLVTASIVIGGAAVMAQEHGSTDSTVETGDQQQTSYLRVIHASPGAPNVDVTLTSPDNETTGMQDDGNETTTEDGAAAENGTMAAHGPFVTNVSFGETSDYKALSAGEYTVTVTPAGDNETVVYEANVTIEPRTANTIAVSGQLPEDDAMGNETDNETEMEGNVSDNETATAPSGLQSAQYMDNALEPDENNTAIRILHLSPDAPAVDVVTENGTVLAANVDFRNSSDYMTVPAGNYTVEIRIASPAEPDDGTEETPVDDTNETETPADMESENASQVGTGAIVATVDVTLEGGHAYSAAAVGLAGATEDADGTAFGVRLIEDATITLSPMMAADGPMGNETQTTTETEAIGEDTTTETEAAT